MGCRIPEQGSQGGIEIGQVFQVIEISAGIGGFGHLANKRAGPMSFFLKKPAVARIEKSCGRLSVGNYLLPSRRKKPSWGRTSGMRPMGRSERAVRLHPLPGEIITSSLRGLGHHRHRRGSGVQIGQQMTIFKRIWNPSRSRSGKTCRRSASATRSSSTWGRRQRRSRFFPVGTPFSGARPSGENSLRPLSPALSIVLTQTRFLLVLQGLTQLTSMRA